MPRCSLIQPHGVWPVAMLYAGLVVNAGLLEYVGMDYNLAAHPVRLSLTLLLYVFFLCVGVFYIPVRLGNLNGSSFEHVVKWCVGDKAAWVFQRFIVPVWAIAWFAYVSFFAMLCMELAFFYRDSSQPGPGIARNILIAVVWFALIAPAAGAPLPQLARSSVFVAKVSFAVVLGLAVSSAKYVPNTVAWINYEVPAPMLPLESHLLFWAVAPVLLAGHFVHGYGSNRRAMTKVMIVGIAIPLAFAAFAAVSTTAVDAGVDMRFRWMPVYSSAVSSITHQLGWVKVLLLTFTLLTAARYAASLSVGSLCRERSLGAGAVITAILLAASFGMRAIDWRNYAWQYAAIPFAPLAGVLCGAFAVTRAPGFALDSRDQHLSVLAWIAGCITTCIPTWWTGYPAYSGMKPAWVLLGWTVSFTATYLAHTIRRHSANSLNRRSPEVVKARLDTTDAPRSS